jgi:uncharacterized protein (DUF1499 family)
MTTWWSKSVFYGALVAVVLLPLAALGSRFGLWPFTLGFLGLAVGTGIALIGVILGLIGIVVVRKRGLTSDRVPLYAGLAVCVGILLFIGQQFSAARTVPAIHNISTDVDDPPAIVELVAARGDSNAWEYDAETLAAVQRGAYPDVKPLVLSDPPEVVFQRVPGVLEAMGLEVVAAHPERGLVEATDTTFWFGFKDDVAVRVAAQGGGSVVDVHSVSRVGQSDLGVNARRISEILRRLGSP